MARFGRAYKDADEKARRQEVFGANARHVDAVNRSGNRTYTLGLNHFSDLTDHEFLQQHLGYRHHQPGPGGLLRPEDQDMSKATALADYGQDVPDSVDWRAQGAVTEIKNQRSCGSCWAFAAVAATEGLVKIATGNLISMSEQQVLDCTGDRSSCDSGYISDALRYVVTSGGLQREAAYAYTGQKGACGSRRFARPNSAASVGGVHMATLNGDEGALQGLAARQPVAVIVEASEPDFRHYSSGVYAGSASCGRELNHALTVVGYGTENGAGEYWLVKNQWGTWWGENGYMRVARRNGAGANCGIASVAFYPTMYYS